MNLKIKILILSAISAMFMVVNPVATKANNIEVGFFGGLSIPSDEMSHFFNSDTIAAKIDSLEGVGNFITDAATDFGYNLGIMVRFELNERFSLVASLAYNRFNSGRYRIAVQDTVQALKMDTISAKNTITLFPISAGINAYLLKTSLIKLYAVGNLSYNLTTTNVDIKNLGSTMVELMSFDKTDQRLGCGLGAGIDLDLKVITLNLEGRYNFMNIIGKDSGEQQKNYFALSLGVIL